MSRSLQGPGKRATAAKYVGFSNVDSKRLQKQVKSMVDSKQGRKVVREASKAALQIFNKETAKNAAALDLKPSGKGWRKLLQKDSSYKYKASAKANGSFSASTGINYAKAVLRISHLVERGFRHFKAGKISGNWFRMDAFRDKKQAVFNRFYNNMAWGYDRMNKTGKAPSASQMRKRFK